MAKTKEQVLATAGLTPQEKERVEQWFEAQRRLKKGADVQMAVNTVAETKAFIKKLTENYTKRKARQEQQHAKKVAENAQIQTIKALIDEGAKYGFGFEDIVAAINEAMKEQRNAAIRAQIAELEAQLL